MQKEEDWPVIQPGIGIPEGEVEEVTPPCSYYRCTSPEKASYYCESCQTWYCSDHIQHFCDPDDDEDDWELDYGYYPDPYDN